MRRILYVLLLLIVMQALAQDDSNSGTIDDDTPYYAYPFEVSEDNAAITIDMQQTSGDLDPLVHLLDSGGVILGTNDDYNDSRTHSRLEVVNLPAGSYTVIATRYKQAEGNTSGDFTLTIDVGTTEQTVIELDASPEAIAANGFPEIETRDHADWVIFAYYGGDTNLEGSILADLDEFERGGGSDNTVRVIALVDRSPQHDTSNGDWNTVHVFEVSSDTSGDYDTAEVPTIDSAIIAELGQGDIDTGDGATLAQFLVWGLQYFPADHYAIAFGSHGAAWQGLITDDSAGELNPELGATTILSLSELNAAFDLALTSANLERFDLLINDACNMSSLEYYGVVQSYFDWSIASPEVVINPALDMSLFATQLRQGESDIATIGEILVNWYIDEDMAAHSDFAANYSTNAVTDLQQFNGVENALSEFADLMNSDIVRYAPIIGQARANVYGYPITARNQTLIDVGDFMQQVIINTTDAEVITAAEAVLDALAITRVYAAAGAVAGERIGYYNIYFPQSLKEYENSYGFETPLIAWATMLRRYYAAFTADVWTGGDGIAFHEPIVPTVSVARSYPDVGSVTNPFVIDLDVTGRRIAEGEFTVDLIGDGETVRLLSRPLLSTYRSADGEQVTQNLWAAGIDTRATTWDGYLPVISDGETSNFALVVENGDGIPYLEGRYQEADSDEWIDVGVIFEKLADRDDTAYPETIISRSEGISAIARNTGSQATAVIEIPEGANFQAYRFVVTADGDLQREVDETTFVWGENGVTLTMEPSLSGEYQLGFLVTAFGGDTAFTNIEVEVAQDEERLPEGTIVANNPDYGFTTPPVDEYRVAADGMGRLGDLSMYLSKLEIQDEVDIGRFVADIMANHPSISRMQTEDLQPYELDGAEAYRFEFSIMTGDEGDDDRMELSSSALLILRDSNHYMVLTPSNEACLPEEGERPRLQDITDCLEAQLSIADELIFYESLAPGDNWQRLPLDSAQLHKTPAGIAVPSGWRVEDNGIWTLLTTPDSSAFAAVTQLIGNDTASILDALMSAEVLVDVSDYEAIEQRVYYGEKYTWDVQLYSLTRDGTEHMGRLYVTYDVYSDYSFAIWVEAPVDEADTLFGDYLELMLDGFNSGEINWRIELGDTTFYIPRDRYDLYTNDAGIYELRLSLQQNFPYTINAVEGVDSLDAVLAAIDLTGDAISTTFNGYDALTIFSETRLENVPPDIDPIVDVMTTVIYLPDDEMGIVMSCVGCGDGLSSFDAANSPFHDMAIGERFNPNAAMLDDDEVYRLSTKTVTLDGRGVSVEIPSWWSVDGSGDAPIRRILSPSGNTYVWVVVANPEDTPDAPYRANLTIEEENQTRIKGRRVTTFTGTRNDFTVQGMYGELPSSDLTFWYSVEATNAGELALVWEMAEDTIDLTAPTNENFPVEEEQESPELPATPQLPQVQATPIPPTLPPVPTAIPTAIPTMPPPPDNNSGGGGAPPPPDNGGGGGAPPPPDNGGGGGGGPNPP